MKSCSIKWMTSWVWISNDSHETSQKLFQMLRSGLPIQWWLMRIITVRRANCFPWRQRSLFAKFQFLM